MTGFPKKHLTVGGEDHFLPSLISSINYATEIYIASAFIRMTGLDLIEGALIDALKNKTRLKIITGDYLSITEPQALRQLMLLKEMGADVRIFCSGNTKSFHMKSYIFTRFNSDNKSGCAFIGSSNITRSALQSGLEWNIKIDKNEDEDRFSLIMNEFNSLFLNESSLGLTHHWIDSYTNKVKKINVPQVEPGADEFIDIPQPNSIQIEALDALTKTREKGHERGLVVLATGLGKTWLSAFDTQQANAKRVLFVAHREEILDQAENTFVRIRPDDSVGRYTGIAKETEVDMLFASVQTLGRLHHLEKFPKDYFDYIVVDEFHHASARTYQQLLAHFTPRFLLGLTATPERTDQADILSLCDDNLVYTKDLFDGIKSKILCNFSYYGLADTVDYSNYEEIGWRNQRFDPSKLTVQLATLARAKHALEHWKSLSQTRTLAFCISTKHADFMTDFFNKNGIPSLSVHTESDTRRNEAIELLRSEKIKVVFSVDIFNEGVDIPSIDTILMLRPTESKILFLQQLGRGLRQCRETHKERVVVIDFIGNHVSFFRKPEALFGVGVTNKERNDFIDLADPKKDGELLLPPGCFVNYDPISIDIMRKLSESRMDVQNEVYDGLCESLQRRPTLVEFYRAGGSVSKIREEHGQWFDFVKYKNGFDNNEMAAFDINCHFFREVETTKMQKSFKPILLEALIALDGFRTKKSVEDVSRVSFEILQRKRQFLADIPQEFKTEFDLKKWVAYWIKNPIFAWSGNHHAVKYFSVIDGYFSFDKEISDGVYDSFVLLVQELINYKYTQYENISSGVEGSTSIAPVLTANFQKIPYFSDLKIACGHFKTSAHEIDKVQDIDLPLSYGRLDSTRYFIARASGNSMDGGKSPIKDGDFLLLELITPQTAGLINGNVIAIERQDSTGDDQYLLRKAEKNKDGTYTLIAFNEKYNSIVAEDDMNTFARLKNVISPNDMLIHREIYRREISAWFKATKGNWLMSGHICPSDTADQFLLVTLNKSQSDKNYKYHDYFKSRSLFHWQSQNDTDDSDATGLGVINHRSNNSSLHLFVRKNPKISGKGSPFVYCGKVDYLSHSGSKPISFDLQLQTPLTSDLYEYFK